MESIFLKLYSDISKFNVSRETCLEFEAFISMIEERNKKINLISRKIVEKSSLDIDI